jgi:hypothetical protein
VILIRGRPNSDASPGNSPSDGGQQLLVWRLFRCDGCFLTGGDRCEAFDIGRPSDQVTLNLSTGLATQKFKFARRFDPFGDHREVEATTEA